MLFLSDSRSQCGYTISKVQRMFCCCGLLDLLSKAVPSGSALGLRHSLPFFFFCTCTSLDSLQTKELCEMPHSPRTLPQLNLIASQLVWLHLERRQLGRILSHGLFPRFPKPGGRGWKLLIFFFPILQMQRCLSCVPLRRLNPQALFTTAASAQPLTSPWNISSTITTVPQFSSDSFQINEEKGHLPYTMDGHVPFNNSYSIVMSVTTHRRSFHQLSWKKDLVVERFLFP